LTRFRSPENPHGYHHTCIQSRQPPQLTLVRHRVCPHFR
jgi:hypothetical protein